MLPCENSLAGRVSDIHHLLPGSGLFIIGEWFQRVEHCLLGVRGATISDIKRAHSHSVALGQVRRILADLRLQPVVEADTAGSAKLALHQWGSKEDVLIALLPWPPKSTGQEILRAKRRGRRPQHHPLLRRRAEARRSTIRCHARELMTTFVFRVRNVPAALYMLRLRRLRHQQRQHDLRQPGKLARSTASSPPPSSSAMSRATLEQPPPSPGTGRMAVLLDRDAHPRRLSRWRRSALTQSGSGGHC